MLVLLIRLTATLLQHRSIQAGGLVGTGLPQVMVRLLHRSVGAAGRTVTVRMQVLLVPQHRSVACQVWLMVWTHPVPLLELPVSVTITLLQQGSVQAGGLVGTGLPHVIVKLLHSSVGVAGTTVIVRTQLLLPPQHRSMACQVWEMVW